MRASVCACVRACVCVCVCRRASRRTRRGCSTRTPPPRCLASIHKGGDNIHRSIAVEEARRVEPQHKWEVPIGPRRNKLLSVEPPAGGGKGAIYNEGHHAALPGLRHAQLFAVPRNRSGEEGLTTIGAFSVVVFNGGVMGGVNHLPCRVVKPGLRLGRGGAGSGAVASAAHPSFVCSGVGASLPNPAAIA